MNAIKHAPLTAVMLLIMILGAALLLALPKQDFSQMENRTLSTVNWKNGEIDRQLENYLADHFPFHDTLVQAQSSLASLAGRKLQNDALIGSGGWLFETPQRQVSTAAAASLRVLNRLVAACDVPFYMMMAPTSAAAVDHLPPLYDGGDQQAVLADMQSRLENVTWLPSGLTERADAEELYYRTDHHLTLKGTRVCYESLCRAWGLTPFDAEPYQAEGFLGSYWSKAPLLQIEADTFTCDLPSGVQLTVDGERRDSLLNPERMQGRNKYAALIDSVYGHAVLENQQASGSLVIIGDSYANCLSPMLARHFGRIDLVDPRYFAEDFEQVLRDSGADRVLVYYGLNTFSASRAMANLMR